MLQRLVRSRPVRFVRAVSNSWSENGGFHLSAAIAYYGAISLFPLLMVLIAGIGYLSQAVPQLQLERQQLLEVVEQNAGPWMAEQISEILTNVQARAGVGGPIGILVLSITAVGVFLQIESVFDQIWKAPRQTRGMWGAIRQVFRVRLTAFLMLLSLGAFIVVVWVVNVALTGVAWYLRYLPGTDIWWRAIQFAMSIALNAVLFMLVYKTLPKAPVSWTSAAIGGLFVALTWQIGLRLLESFIISDRYDAYGLIGSFLAVMLWMYYAGAAFILGAEIVRAASTTAPTAVSTRAGKSVGETASI